MNDLREFVVVMLGCLSANMAFWYLIRPLFDSCLSTTKGEIDNDSDKLKRVEFETKPEPNASDPEIAAKAQNYNELIMAVARIFPGESRHETALRYIQEAERDCLGGPDQDKENP